MQWAALGVTELETLSVGERDTLSTIRDRDKQETCIFLINSVTVVGKTVVVLLCKERHYWSSLVWRLRELSLITCTTPAFSRMKDLLCIPNECVF